MNRNRRHLLLGTCAAGALAALSLGSMAQAATLVNDTWQDGTRSDPAAPVYAENNGVVGTDADSDGDIESAWFKGGSGTLTPSVGMLAGVTTTSSSSWFSYFTPAATPATLVNAGDTLKVTLVFRGVNINATNTSQGFPIALVQAPSASRVTGDASVPSAAYAGYAMFMNLGQTLGNSSPFQLREWALASGTSGALLGTSGNWTGLVNGASSGNHGYDSATDYTFEMDLTRNASNGLDITATMTGGTLNGVGSATVSYSDATPSSFSYDLIDMRPSSTALTGDEIDIKSFKVELTSVPEPASLAVLGLGAMSMFRRRRA